MKTTSLLTISAVLIIASCSDGGPKPRVNSDGSSGQAENNSTGGADSETTSSPKDQPTEQPVIQPASNIPTYALGIKPLIDQYCISGHGAGGKPPALDTLAKLKDNYAKIVSTMKSGSMPKGHVKKVPAGAQAMFVSWGTSPNAPYGQWAP